MAGRDPSGSRRALRARRSTGCRFAWTESFRHLEGELLDRHLDACDGLPRLRGGHSLDGRAPPPGAGRGAGAPGGDLPAGTAGPRLRRQRTALVAAAALGRGRARRAPSPEGPSARAPQAPATGGEPAHAGRPAAPRAAAPRGRLRRFSRPTSPRHHRTRRKASSSALSAKKCLAHRSAGSRPTTGRAVRESILEPHGH